MTERELEKLFKSKLNNREFAFNPANWEKMEGILDQKAVAGGRYFWRSAAAILLFGVVVASVIYYNPGTISQYDGISGPDFIPEGRVLPNMKPEVELNMGSEDPASIAFEEAKNLDQVSPESPSTKSDISKKSTETEMSSVGHVERDNSITNDNQSTVSSTSAVEQSVSNVFGDGSEGVGLVENFEFTEPLELSSKDYVLPELAAINFTVRDAELLGNAQELPPQRRINTSSLFVNAGPVFTGSNTSNTLGTGFLAGVGYRKGLNYGFGVEAGLNYFVLNNVNIQNYSDSVFYRFGKERIETEEVNSRLDYLEVPLNLTCKLAPKHQLGVGGYAAVLLNVSRDITKTTHTPKSGTYVEDEKASGYLDEFNRFDFGLNAFYRYSISSRLNIGIHFKQGLMDITHDVSEGYAQDHTNFNTRIVLEYSLF